MSWSRQNLEFIEDLELRLAPPYLRKGGALRFFPCPDLWEPVITEEDLELRLAPLRYCGSSNDGPNISEDGLKNSHSRKHGKECTNLHRNYYLPKERCVHKLHQSKCGQASSSHSDFKELKLRCVICMDTMKEETSTTCGHVFCKPCITTVILAQKRCPACRVKLSMSNIHRIYLPGATS